MQVIRGHKKSVDLEKDLTKATAMIGNEIARQTQRTNAEGQDVGEKIKKKGRGL